MELFETKNIRNVCLLGHGGAGKTSLAEAMLYIAKATDRLGKVTDGNTVSDYDAEEIRRGFSISASIAPLVWQNIKVNVLDTPGYPDFEGEVRQAIRVADAALIVVDGKAGIEVGTELAWDMAEELGIPKSFFINRFDDPEARFYKVFEALRERFGVAVCPVQIPMIDEDKVTGFLDLLDFESYIFDSATGDYVSLPIPEQFMEIAEKYRNMLYESIAQTDEALMEQFFAGEPISREDSVLAIHNGIISGEIVPVFCGAATKMWGVKTLLDTIADSYPRHTAKKVELSEDGDEIAIDKEGSVTSLFVYKTYSDPFVGKMSFFKVMNGTLRRDDTLRNLTSDTQEKISRIYVVRGKKQEEVQELACGDIGMTSKLVATSTNDTLTNGESNAEYAKITYPKAYASKAVVPAGKGDEDKISGGIARLLEEDSTMRFENNAETKQLVLYGLGDTHLDIAVAKLKNRFGTSVVLETPRIPYRETIRKRVDTEGKHKKQSGGSGQYGHVKIVFEPGEEEGLTFTTSVVGGSVPKNYFPAVEKGLQDCMAHGVLAGYPLVRLAANLYDGSYHDVDSNEISFKLAAALAYKNGIPNASPVLLEPVGELRVYTPDAYVGDVMGDLNRRRGRVNGIEAAHKAGQQVVIAEVPTAEMTDYVVALRAMTQGRARFDFTFVRYEEVPANVAQKIIAEAPKEA
ncbi:MAG: elongation factor G [Clostridia bacterium]|nr:elongation factor G [Clostridia bacterium]